MIVLFLLFLAGFCFSEDVNIIGPCITLPGNIHSCSTKFSATKMGGKVFTVTEVKDQFGNIYNPVKPAFFNFHDVHYVYGDFEHVSSFTDFKLSYYAINCSSSLGSVPTELSANAFIANNTYAYGYDSYGCESAGPGGWQTMIFTPNYDFQFQMFKQMKNIPSYIQLGVNYSIGGQHHSSKISEDECSFSSCELIYNHDTYNTVPYLFERNGHYFVVDHDYEYFQSQLVSRNVRCDVLGSLAAYTDNSYNGSHCNQQASQLWLTDCHFSSCAKNYTYFRNRLANVRFNVSTHDDHVMVYYALDNDKGMVSLVYEDLYILKQVTLMIQKASTNCGDNATTFEVFNSGNGGASKITLHSEFATKTLTRYFAHGYTVDIYEGGSFHKVCIGDESSTNCWNIQEFCAFAPSGDKPLVDVSNPTHVAFIAIGSAAGFILLAVLVTVAYVKRNSIMRMCGRRRSSATDRLLSN